MHHPAANSNLLSVRIRFESFPFSICRDDVTRDMTIVQLLEQVRPNAPIELQRGCVVMAFDSGEPIADSCVSNCQRTGRKHDCELLLRRSTQEEVDAVIEATLAQEEVEKALRKRDVTYLTMLEVAKKYKKAKV